MQKIIAFALIFIGAFMALVAAPAEIETIQIAMQADSYRSTIAEVTNVRTQSHGKGPSTEIVEFDYRVDGRTYHGDNHLTQFDDSRADINAQIQWRNGEKFTEVYYDPDHPDTVLLHQDVGLLVPVGVLIATAACLYGGVSSYLEDRRMKLRADERRQGSGRSAR